MVQPTPTPQLTRRPPTNQPRLTPLWSVQLADAVAVSLACGVATAPILLLQFGRIPLYSVPANALAAPVVGPLLGLGFVTAAVQPLSPAVAAALAWANGCLAAYLAGCARLIGGLPGATVSSGRGLAILVALAVAAALGLRSLRLRQGPCL